MAWRKRRGSGRRSRISAFRRGAVNIALVFSAGVSLVVTLPDASAIKVTSPVLAAGGPPVFTLDLSLPTFLLSADQNRAWRRVVLLDEVDLSAIRSGGASRKSGGTQPRDDLAPSAAQPSALVGKSAIRSTERTKSSSRGSSRTKSRRREIRTGRSGSGRRKIRWETVRISSPFGWRRLNGRLRHHDGIDIAFRYGTPVEATQDGVVSFAGWRGGYGRTVIIDHGFGKQTLYAHNSRLLVKRGQRVKEGQVIARVGHSGRAFGTHLHYELRFDGRPVDPTAEFRAYQERRTRRILASLRSEGETSGQAFKN
ncbi:MAG: M23 family metallopeptidase [Candidatus Hydrogenedentota bacterium]|nr:MAG: M23 family metallopeptidase [Candidatus Hydrogenedentota bacterium]